jgi:hypothetical protein
MVSKELFTARETTFTVEPQESRSPVVQPLSGNLVKKRRRGFTTGQTDAKGNI